MSDHAREKIDILQRILTIDLTVRKRVRKDSHKWMDGGEQSEEYLSKEKYGGEESEKGLS